MQNIGIVCDDTTNPFEACLYILFINSFNKLILSESLTNTLGGIYEIIPNGDYTIRRAISITTFLFDFFVMFEDGSAIIYEHTKHIDLINNDCYTIFKQKISKLPNVKIIKSIEQTICILTSDNKLIHYNNGKIIEFDLDINIKLMSIVNHKDVMFVDSDDSLVWFTIDTGKIYTYNLYTIITNILVDNGHLIVLFGDNNIKVYNLLSEYKISEIVDYSLSDLPTNVSKVLNTKDRIEYDYIINSNYIASTVTSSVRPIGPLFFGVVGLELKGILSTTLKKIDTLKTLNYNYFYNLGDYTVIIELDNSISVSKWSFSTGKFTKLKYNFTASLENSKVLENAYPSYI